MNAQQKQRISCLQQLAAASALKGSGICQLAGRCHRNNISSGSSSRRNAISSWPGGISIIATAIRLAWRIIGVAAVGNANIAGGIGVRHRGGGGIVAGLAKM